MIEANGHSPAENPDVRALSCHCGVEVASGRRGQNRQWCSDACRKRTMRLRAHDRRRRRAANHQMIDLGAMSIQQRQQALLEAARAAMRTDHRLAGWS
jgi:hypothetical protein